MGEVYRARDTKLHREVAIKVLPGLFSSDQDALARLEREARILAAFNHPNIATIYGLEERPGLTAIVMELVEGEALDARLRAKGKLSVGETMTIARQLVDALDAAHERGIIHRDLKPANIKLTLDSVAKVLDFGLARDPVTASGETDTCVSPVTQPGLILGTAAYMSPEQARGLAVDRRADIWAFGCVLYECLTGASPFAGASISDVIAHVLEREPDWNALPPSTPRPLVRLIQRCLQKDTKKRLRDIADARVDLDESLTAPPTTLAPATSGSSLPWAVVVAAAVTIAVSWWLFRAREPIAPHLSRAVRLTNSAAHEFSPAISPDNKWVAYYSEWQGRSDVWVKFLDSGSTINLTSSLNLDLSVRALIGGLDLSGWHDDRRGFSISPRPARLRHLDYSRSRRRRAPKAAVRTAGDGMVPGWKADRVHSRSLIARRRAPRRRQRRRSTGVGAGARWTSRALAGLVQGSEVDLFHLLVRHLADGKIGDLSGADIRGER